MQGDLGLQLRWKKEEQGVFKCLTLPQTPSQPIPLAGAGNVPEPQAPPCLGHLWGGKCLQRGSEPPSPPAPSPMPTRTSFHQVWGPATPWMCVQAPHPSQPSRGPELRSPSHRVPSHPVPAVPGSPHPLPERRAGRAGRRGGAGGPWRSGAQPGRRPRAKIAAGLAE